MNSKEKKITVLVAEFQTQKRRVRNEVLAHLCAEHTEASGEFFCRVLSSIISVPCKATECDYHIGNNRVSHNCLAKHCFDSGKDGISIEELSDLTDIPASRIRSSQEKSFNRVRSHTVESEINAGAHNRFDYFRGVHVCVVCGSRTPEKAFRVDDESEALFYCSRTCYKKKPPSLIRLEVRYRTDIRVVLGVAKRVLKKLPIIASALDVKRRLVLKWYDEFLGIHASEFGMDAVDYADIVRRSTPRDSWELDFLNNVYTKPTSTTNNKLLELELETRSLCKNL